jgi:uncharacterized membrane protein YfcA
MTLRILWVRREEARNQAVMWFCIGLLIGTALGAIMLRWHDGWTP